MVLNHDNGSKGSRQQKKAPRQSRAKDERQLRTSLSEEEILLQWSDPLVPRSYEKENSYKNHNVEPVSSVSSGKCGTEKHNRRSIESGSCGPCGSEQYLAIDCEFVGVGSNGEKSAPARVSIVNWEGGVVLDTFIKVPVPVTDFRTFVSGIRAEHIESKNAMCFEDCRALVHHLLKGKILIGHGLENDLKALRISHPWYDTRDSAIYPPLMREVRDPATGRCGLSPRKLRDLAWEKIGHIIQADGKPHCSVEDATTSLDLYKAENAEWDVWLEAQIEIARDAEQNRQRMTAPATREKDRSRRGRGQHARVSCYDAPPRVVTPPLVSDRKQNRSKDYFNRTQRSGSARHTTTHGRERQSSAFSLYSNSARVAPAPVRPLELWEY